MTDDVDYRAWFAALSEGVVILEIVYDDSGKPVDYRFVAGNLAFEQLIGMTIEHASGKLITELLGMSPPPFLEEYSRVAETQVPEKLEYYHEGIQRWFSVSVVSAKKGQVATVFEDVTEKRVHEEEMRKYREGLDRLSEVVFMTTTNGEFVYVNKAFTDLYGYTLDELSGKTPRALKSGKQDAAFYEGFWHALKDARSIRVEMINRKKDGSEVVVMASVAPVMNEAGEVTNFMAVQRDVTAEQALVSENQKFRAGIERSSEVVFLTDVDGVITYANPAFYSVYGYTPDEVIGQTPRLIKSGLLSQEAYVRFWDKLLAGEVVTGELVNKTKDGRLVTVEGSANSITDVRGAVVGYIAVQRDISEKKAVEKQLSERIADMEKLNKLVVGRELKMIELKEEIASLKQKLHIEPVEDKQL